MLRLVMLLGLVSTLLAQGQGSGWSEQANTAEHATDSRRRQLQERNMDVVVRLRSLLAEHLSQTPATATPYPLRTVGPRRKLASTAKPLYSTQCLFEPPAPEQPSSSAGATSLRRHLTDDAGGRCYLNPMVLAHPDFPDPESPIEIMLLKSAWTAYQCSFENHPGRCGTYGHPPYDCRWQEDSGRCAVTSEFLLPRLLTYLHCRDDTTITPFWDRCYTVGVLNGDEDWCGQPDGNQARCYWFAARNDSETDFCAPSPAGGVESRDAYDELVAQMRSGVWLRDWFGSCPTAELVFTLKSACNWTSADDCAADPSCTLRTDLPIEYGMCRLKDELIWAAIFSTESLLFNATAAAMTECAAASYSQKACQLAGSLASEPGGKVPLDPEKYSDVIDLVFIEEVTPGAAGRLRTARPSAMLLAAAAALGVVRLALRRVPAAE